jgi:FkbM family methyltransferase
MARAFQAGSRLTSFSQHRGFSLGCRALAATLGRRDIVVRLNDDASFAFPFGDGYWSLLLDRCFRYEDEIERVLTAVRDVDYAFVDCGANFGYWSTLVSSRPYGSHPVLAVEASLANHEKLSRNAELNGGRFTALHRAIGSANGHAWLSGRKHEALSIGQRSDRGAGEYVEVITLDVLLDDSIVASRSRLIVKLDVEGLEIAAIEGGRRMLQRDALLIVEDHGSDRSHAVSRHILAQTPFKIFVLEPLTERFISLNDVSMLDRIKTNPSIGYNVFATASPYWQRQLSGIASRAAHIA